MQAASTTADGVLLDRPKSRRGLPRVDDHGVGARDRVHVPGGRRGDARSATEKIQQGPLDGQHRRERSANLHDPHSGFDPIAVDRERLGLQRSGGARGDSANDRQAAEHSVRPRSDLGPGHGVRRDEGRGGEITGIPVVFGEPAIDRRIEGGGDHALEDLLEIAGPVGFEPIGLAMGIPGHD